MRRLFAVWFCVLACIHAQLRRCSTPNGEVANCVSIHSCQILYDAVTTKNKQQLQFLKESQCGYHLGEPLVCCGSHDNYRSLSSTEFGDDPFSWGGNNRRTTTSSWDEDDDDRSWSGSRRRTTASWNQGTSNRRTNGWGGNNRRTNSDELEDRSTENRRGNQGSSRLPDRASCGIQDADRILSGQATSITEFPWMALLQYRKKNGNLAFSCGGTLISNRYVLTAAHCVRGQILSKIGPLVNVRLGEYNTETDKDCSNQLGFEICNDRPVDSEIEKVIVHPDYSDSNNDRYHDIALIKLKRQAPSTDFIKPICLPTGSERVNVGEKLVVAGWGRTEYSSSSPVKLKLWVPVAAKNQCGTKFKSAGVNIGNKQLCAGGEAGRDSCNGDSGGPLMGPVKNNPAQWYIEGIVSFGAKCGSEGWPGIYTKVSEYLDWIKTNAV